MTVGEALAEARGAAGLSVDEVSESTRIREIVIRSIEEDDFDSLGGDLYVRGYLRAIAGAVGIDPKPLIREFDATRPNGSSGWSALGTSSATAAATAAAAVISEAVVEPVPTMAHGSEAEPEAATVSDDAPDSGSDAWHDEIAADPQVNAEQSWAEQSWAEQSWAEQGWTEQGWTEPVATEAVWAEHAPPASPDTSVATPDEPVSEVSFEATPDLAPSVGENTSVTHALPAARPARRPTKSTRSQPRTRVRGQRWVITISALTIVVLAIVGVAAAQIISKLGPPKSASPVAARATAAPRATAQPATPAAVKSTPVSKPRPTSSAKPPAPVRRLAIQGAGAYRPDGLADGDNPQSASFAVTADAPAPWETDWYTTANFGLLKQGTGLLLDMGKPVTITTVTIALGADWGANLQVRAGDEADLSEMPVVASETDVGGLLTMRLKTPARARYVLIWFVKLPPSGDGTYAASIYSATVEGRP